MPRPTVLHQRRAAARALALAAPATSASARAPLAARLVAALARACRVRRDTRELVALTNHTLHDLGLGRGEIENAVRLGRGWS